MKCRKISGVVCILAWHAGMMIAAIPNWSTLKAQNFIDEPVVDAGSLSAQDYTPPDTARAAAGDAETDTNKTGITNTDSVSADSINAAARTELLLVQKRLAKKGFVGTGTDVGVAFASLVGWLAVMWFAANQH